MWPTEKGEKRSKREHRKGGGTIRTRIGVFLVAGVMAMASRNEDERRGHRFGSQ